MANPPEIQTPKINVQWPDLGAYFKRVLPTKIELNIPDRGMENHLLNFIEDSSKTVDSTTWFNFDRLLFESGSATLKPESQEQLRNVAEILKAYPGVNVKIGGYTDNQGDPASNVKLSQDRASNVKNELARLGVSSNRVESEGYGEQHPVADNSTEVGRAQNRRIALRVTKK
jgi:outer membrane protein OmpA-like peptidoglycan-associated protein